MDEGVNRKRKALELSEFACVRVHVCPTAFRQAKTYSTDRWVIIKQATDEALSL